MPAIAFRFADQLTMLNVRILSGIRNQTMALKRGDMVRAVREQLANSLEAQASDARFPSYLFETAGEIVDLSGDYALVKFGIVPTPNIWLRADQLEAFQ
jgi:Cyanobacterial and plant NDH-1 subunit O